MRMRQLIAVLGHVPAMWLVYRWRPDRRTRNVNLAAISVTVAAMVAVGLTVDPPLPAVIAAWAVGHVAWGAYLARRVA
jgi:hypothetical protein